MQRMLAVVLIANLAFSPSLMAANASGVPTGTVRGTVAIDGRPLAGIELTLGELASGALYHARTTADGRFEIKVAPGDYLVTTTAGAGLTVGRGPTHLVVAANTVVPAAIEMATLPAAPTVLPQTIPAEASSATAPAGIAINHDPIGCIIAGQYPLIPASIEPAANVAKARVYFKGVSSPFYYVEMTAGGGAEGAEAAAAPGAFVGKLPRPRLDAGPVTYYIKATSTNMAEVQSPEYVAIVVNDEKDCLGKKVAGIGPAGDVTVFSTTGAVVNAAGFAAGGAALTGGLLALIIAGGAAAAGVTIAVVGDNTTTTTTPTTIPAVVNPTTTAPPPPVTTTTTPPGPGPRPSPASPTQ